MNIEIPDGTVKIRQDKYVLYNFEWLMKNLDMEFEHLRTVKEHNIDPKNCKIILESLKEKHEERNET